MCNEKLTQQATIDKLSREKKQLFAEKMSACLMLYSHCVVIALSLVNVSSSNPYVVAKEVHYRSYWLYVWRACCYFIILSVVFPDGDWSLLVSPSDLLAR